MANIEPANIVSATALTLVEQLQPNDQVLFKRGKQLYGIEVSELLPDPKPQVWPQYFKLPQTHLIPRAITSYTPPTVTYSTGDWRIKVPVYEPTPVIKDPTIVDARDITAVTAALPDALAFVNRLEIVQGQVDARADYIDWASKPSPPTLEPKPEPIKMDHSHPFYQTYYLDYVDRLERWQVKERIYRQALATYPARLQAWIDKNKPETVVPDGTHRDPAQKLRIMERSLPDARRIAGAPAEQLPDIPVLLLAVQQLTDRLLEVETELRILKEGQTP